MRYDTRQDYEGRPRLDTEDATTEAHGAPHEATEAPTEAPAEPPVEAADEASDMDTSAPTAVTATATAPAPPVADDGTAALWPQDVVQDLQERWREVQWRFVDDPRAAADEAQALVNEALDRFSAAVASRKDELDGWRDHDGSDTEQMRMVVRRYRGLLDRLLEV